MCAVSMVELSGYTTIGVGGVSVAVFPETERELFSALSLPGEKIVIGGGSNVVFSDKGYGGTVIFTRNLNKIEFGDGFIRAYAGVKLSQLISFYLSRGYGGVEFLAGIPASVGGAVAMNAGAFGKNISESIINVAAVADNKKAVAQNKDCDFTYRSSAFCSEHAVIYADFSYYKDENAKENAARYIAARQKKQPAGRSFGSAFKNPQGDYAGRLIELAGLKGYSVGGAAVSEKHANFIINRGGASACDVYALVDYIKKKVYGLFGVMLEEEVRFIGDFG